MEVWNHPEGVAGASIPLPEACLLRFPSAAKGLPTTQRPASAEQDRQSGCAGIGQVKIN